MKTYKFTQKKPTDTKLRGQSSSRKQGTNKVQGLQLPHPSERMVGFVSMMEDQGWKETHSSWTLGNGTRH